MILAAQPAAPGETGWHTLDHGLELGRLSMPGYGGQADDHLAVLRIDPRNWKLQLATARENGETPLTARSWAARKGFVAVINAGMFARDRSTPMGLMIHRGRPINPRLRSWSGILALDPASPSPPSARLIDRHCDSLDSVRESYSTLVQNMRLFDCNGNPVWRTQSRGWSIAALATDATGRILFLFSRMPHSVRAFTQAIRDLPLGITRAMYLEGGGPAQMYIQTGNTEISLYGTHGSRGALLLPRPRAVPNVIGVLPRD